MEKDITDYIRLEYPNLLVYVMDRFSIDYDMFNKTWETLCLHHIPSQPTRKQILILSSFENQELCDFLTEQGFCIRKEHEFQPCSVCGLAIATEKLHDFLKSRGFDLEWSSHCSTCM